ncbi:MAG: hypothetical protein H6737_08215 [Alphaproteobacteria bacterium]|nr:hypothetical protein [Alphaproteobacteria bacterium]
MRVAALVLLAGCLPDLGERSVAAHADRCAECHADAAAEWEASRHARPAESPVFTALRAHAAAELGTAAPCDRCHLPDAVTCVTCHAAAANQETANGALIADPTGPVRGPWGDTVGPHASALGALLTDSALCGTCHEVDGLAGFDEHPYTAWAESPAAADGLRCQDCHMSPEPGVDVPRDVAPVAEGGEARSRSSHAFVGLQADAVDLLSRGLELRVAEGGVELVNLAGHGLPDGASFTRELWVESRDAAGWTGDRRPLHAELRRAGVPTWDPVTADETVFRGVPPGGVRFEPFEVGEFEVCVRYRPVAAGLSEGLGLPVAEPVTVRCVP